MKNKTVFDSKKIAVAIIMFFMACTELLAQTVILPGNNSTSGNGRAPQGSRRYINAKYIITGAERTASGFTGPVASIGWRWNVPFPPAAGAPAAQSTATTGKLRVYVKDTVGSALSMTTGQTFIDTNGIGYTKIIDGTITIPSGAAEINIDVPVGGPGTASYTPGAGSGILIIFVYNTIDLTLPTPLGAPTVFCTTTGAGNMLLTYQSQTVGGVLGATSVFRPETRFGSPVVNDNVGVIAAAVGNLNQILAVSTPYNIVATVKNQGANSQTVVPVYYRVDGGAPIGPVNTVGPIAPNGTEVVTFSGANAFSTAIPGAHVVKVFTALAGDPVASNDTLTLNITVQAALTLPVVEKFTNPVNWTILTQNAVGTTGLWGLGICTGPNGAVNDTAATANCFGASAGRREVLRSPLINLTGQSHPVLHFYAAYRTFITENDSMQVLVSTDGGVTFFPATTVYSKSQNSTPSLATLPASTTAYFPASVMQWRYETVDLTNVAGLNNVVIGFRSCSQFGNRQWVDDVSISNADNVCTNTVSSPGSNSCDPDVTVNLLTANTSASDLMVTRHNNQNPPFTMVSPSIANNSSSTSQNGAIYTPTGIASNAWWHVTYAGDDVTTFTVSPEGHTTFNISINIGSIPCIPSPDSLYILERVDALGPWRSLTTTRTGNILTASGVNRYGDFAVGGSAYNLSQTITTPVITGATTFCSNSSTTLDAGPGYSAYSWSTGASTQTISVNSAATFTVTVTNSVGCTASASATTTVNTAPTPTITGNLAICPGNSTTLDAGSGYSLYSWSTGATTQTISVNFASTFTVTVTDGNGCTGTASATTTLESCCNISLTGIITHVTCNGGFSGSINVTSSNTFGTASYLWNNGNTNEDRTGLSAGTYTVTVNYGSGCTASQSFVVTQPAPLAINATPVNISCRGAANGSITLAPTGNTAPYSYLWNNGSTSQNRTSLAPGTYTVTVNDANLCGSVTQTFTITQPATNLIINSSKTNVRCNGLESGLASVSPAGGTAPYTYSWNTIPVKTTASISGLAAGVYTCTVTDFNGCTKTIVITITEPPALSAIQSQTNVTFPSGNDGTASVSVSGGTPGYTYSWNTSPVKTTASVTGLTAGVYKCTITDSKGCLLKVTFTITEPSSKISQQAGDQTKITVFPNPSNGLMIVKISGTEDEEMISLELFDISGRLVYLNNTSWASEEERLFDFSTLNKGAYFMHCKSASGNTIQKIIIQ